MPRLPRTEERVGSEIAGKYQLLRLLGEGGMGAVYEAVHEFTQRRVAVKLMQPGFARAPLAAERFLREAQAPSTIGHPGIVQVLDGGQDTDGSLYLVLELLEGETLAAPIKAHALAPQRLCAIVLELLAALEAAHEAGFVHRDIKPENVFLVGDPGAEQVKLLDFGVAGVVGVEGKPGLTSAGSVLGTPLYMSPEQALGRRVDARADLWSVGAVMYQALSGRAPFAGESFQALMVSIATEEHLPLSVIKPELPLRLCAVVERALQKDVGQRWQSAAEMAEALRRALEDGSRTRRDGARAQLNAPVAPALAAATRHASERRTVTPLLAGALALGVLVVAGAVWAGLPRARQPRAQHAAPAPRAIAKRAALAPQPALAAVRDVHTAPTPATSSALPSASTQVVPSVSDTSPKQNQAPAVLDAEHLSQVLREHDRELQRCYEDAVIATLMRAAAEKPEQIQPLHLDFELDVGAAGEVGRVVVHGDASQDMRACVTRAISSWKFPNSQGSTQLRFPVIFQPKVVQR